MSPWLSIAVLLGGVGAFCWSLVTFGAWLERWHQRRRACMTQEQRDAEDKELEDAYFW